MDITYTPQRCVLSEDRSLNLLLHSLPLGVIKIRYYLIYNTKASEDTILDDWHVADALFRFLDLPE